MKKSTILKVLGERVANYAVRKDTETNKQFLIVRVWMVNWIQLSSIVENVLHIMPIDAGTFEITFDSEVVID